MKSIEDEAEIQRQYYAETADQYEEMHVDEKDEHYLALSFLSAAMEYLDASSVLDLGSGTGRAVRYLKEHRPSARVVGIEPVEALREVGYSKGLSESDLRTGDATDLAYEDAAFDIVCEFGALHHIKRPERAISEMLRVAEKAVFIADTNNFGEGAFWLRTFKQVIRSLGLWTVVDLIKTGGKGYRISEGDGLSYAYSVFDNYGQIEEQCKSIHILNTKDGRINPYRTASHITLLGIKK